MSLAVEMPPVTVYRRAVADPGDLLQRLADDAPVAWVRGDEGLVGWGEAARFEVTGADAVARARLWWRDQLSRFVFERGDGAGGPVCFASLAFDPTRDTSVFVLPRVVLTRRAGRTSLISIGRPGSLAPTTCPDGPASVSYSDGALSQAEWCAAVEAAVTRIDAGQLRKVVLARDLRAHATPSVDPRFLLQRLASRYPECWTFAVDGLVGATPELLVRRTGDRIASRVLAGTSRRGSGAEDEALAAALVGSAKDREEHAYAVASVVDTLGAYCADLDVPGAPQVLRLATLSHLATTVEGRLDGPADVLDLVEALHPTAAVCGTPRDAARNLIHELEAMPRGRYAGPVGWMDGEGDGEFGIALRCAEIDGPDLRLFAGCGIVAGSEPAAELAESQAKLVTMRDALEGVG